MEQPFRAAFEQSVLGMALITPEGRWMEVNDSLCRITGYTRQELTALSIRDLLYEKDTEDDRQQIHDLEEGSLRSIRVEKRLIHKDGHFVLVSASVSVIRDAVGQPLFFAVQVEDSDEGKQAGLAFYKKEPAFQSLFDQNPDAVFSVDLQGNFTGANEKALQLAECRREELLTRNFAEFCDPQGLACILGNFPKAEKGVSFNFEIGITTCKGNNRYLKITNMPVVIDDKIVGINCVAKDITQRKLLQEEKGVAQKISKLFDGDACLDESLFLTLKEMCRYLQVPVAEAWITSSNGKDWLLYTQYRAADHEQLPCNRIKLPRGEGLIGKAEREKQPVFMDLLDSHPDFIRKEFARENGLQYAAATPVLVHDEVMAVFVFYTSKQDGLSTKLPFKDDFLAQLAGDIRRKRSEEELNRFFTFSFDMLCVVGFDGSFKKINWALTRTLGHQQDQIGNSSFSSFVHPDDRIYVEAEMKRLTTASCTVHFENRYILKNGTIKWVAWTFTSLATEELMYGVGRDITEAKNLEKALRRERQRFSDMFYEAPVTMCIMRGPNLILESANDLYFRFTGRNRNSLNKPIREAFPEVEGQGIFELIQKVYQTGEFYSENERLVALDRKGNGHLEDVYLSFLYQPFYNEEGKIEGVFFFGVDVTEQVHARKKIEESRKQYVDLIQNLPAAVYTCDAQGYILLYNRAAASLWGREPEMGKDKWNGAWRLYDTEGKILPHESAPMAQCIKEGKPIRGQEYQLQQPDGSMRQVVPFPSPVFDTEGRLTGGVNVLIDITGQKRVDEELVKLSLIAKKTVNAVILTDPEGRIEWVNDAFSRITGYTFQEAIGKKTASILHGEKTDPRTVDYIIEKRKRQETFECEILKYTKDRRPFWVEKQAQPLFDAKGRLTRYFELETDITERKKVYEELVRTKNEARNFARQLNELLEEERSRIAREIHDEFGQQLTGIKMSLYSLLKLSESDERTRVIGSDIMKDVENSIRSLRSFATELRPGILDTLGLVPSIDWLVRELEKKTGISCRVSIGVKRQTFDPNISIAFFRICQEALTNISKHAQASAVVVELIQRKEYLSLTISDNGKGIRADKLKDQLSMGLIGMRERASLIGGDLNITNNNNQGTTIHLTVKVDA